jgi:GT2 family glycosyltransferase
MTRFLAETLAVLVLYKVRLDASDTFLSLTRSLKKSGRSMEVLVYDNSPTPMVRDEDLARDGLLLHYISDPANPGVSRAYNRGFEIARQRGRKWLLLLDQDTAFPDDALSCYTDAVEAHGDSLLFAPVLVCGSTIYSPCANALNLNYHVKAVPPGKVRARGKSLLSSGMCIHVDAFARAGGFDEGIPLDFADHDFMKRYRRHFDSFVVLDLVCAHAFSDREPSDMDRALTRFDYYCKGARGSIKSIPDALSLPPLAFLRAARLCVRFGSLTFLRRLFRAFLRG